MRRPDERLRPDKLGMRNPSELEIDPERVAAIEAEHPYLLERTIEAMVREAERIFLKATRLPSDAPQWMRTLKVKGPIEAAMDPGFKAEFTDKLNSGDGGPLKSLIEKHREAFPPTAQVDFDCSTSKEKVILLDHWIKKSTAPYKFSFCYYSDIGIAELLGYLGGTEPRSVTSVRQVYERLGLERSRHHLFQSVKIETKSGMIVPVPFGSPKTTH
jgi:hypothetical protein